MGTQKYEITGKECTCGNCSIYVIAWMLMSCNKRYCNLISVVKMLIYSKYGMIETSFCGWFILHKWQQQITVRGSVIAFLIRLLFVTNLLYVEQLLHSSISWWFVYIIIIIIYYLPPLKSIPLLLQSIYKIFFHQ